MNLTGWIIYNGHLSGEKFIDFAQWLHKAASRKQINTSIIKNNECLSYLDKGTLTITGKNDILPDFVLFTDKDIYLARQFEMLGIRVFNSAETIAVSDDKIATYQTLAKHGLAIPKTIIGPKIFPGAELDARFSQYAVHELGFPLIVKEAYGSFGEQVHLIHNQDELDRCIEELNDRPFVFQAFVSSSYGRDIRLHVVGDQVVAAMTRHASNDFRANITAGGSMKAYTPSSTEAQLAIKASQVLGADFAGIDLLFGEEDSPVICEVNSNAHIRNMYDATGINVADYMIDHVIKIMNQDGGYQQC
ncbi:Coenzyme gamma-F420-2:alpha-L-glutamate ligase [Lentibacillus sp. JNUCC-1]|uniref:ATP-grasp domain-containing protein n=1 Tax=Lentibacillus sp. JNUCC-1 TaxID=2654513 RepID=UPI0012E967CC|nr:RimK family alpha-L-glutamate ligase [Lentibacillus sp. JNUCC-1]MUV39426.1 Coenzyme gamma-F420-2:alpha-L-glutamate ligase [Lentibacillus sp. JNUCC-1]